MDPGHPRDRHVGGEERCLRQQPLRGIQRPEPYPAPGKVLQSLGRGRRAGQHVDRQHGKGKDGAQILDGIATGVIGLSAEGEVLPVGLHHREISTAFRHQREVFSRSGRCPHQTDRRIGVNLHVVSRAQRASEPEAGCIRRAAGNHKAIEVASSQRVGRQHERGLTRETVRPLVTGGLRHGRGRQHRSECCQQKDHRAQCRHGWRTPGNIPFVIRPMLRNPKPDHRAESPPFPA